MIRTSRQAPTRNGGYLLMSYPGCTSLHTGQWRGESSFVVGRNTEQERIYRRTDLAAASEYAIATGLAVESIPNSGLCDQAVVDVWGG